MFEEFIRELKELHDQSVGKKTMSSDEFVKLITELVHGGVSGGVAIETHKRLFPTEGES